MPDRLSLPSFAKINWTLRVIGKRDDGFHELCTVYQTVSLSDEITFAPAKDISLTCSDPTLPTDSRNLVVKAAEAFRSHCNIADGAAICLKKLIPSSGGLGGGSSNAAVTLLGLKRLWEVDISDDDLNGIAAGIGSDVPFFLYGGTAIGTGRGELIEPLADTESAFLVIVTPGTGVSTPAAFGELKVENLTIEARNRILRVCRDEARTWAPGQTALTNDLETPVFAMFPEIGEIKDALLSLGASSALMSGSGASVFGIFENEETRQAAIKALGDKPTWRSFAVATISRARYCDELNALGCFR